MNAHENQRDGFDVARPPHEAPTAWVKGGDGSNSFYGDYDAIAFSPHAPVVKATPFLDWHKVHDAQGVPKAAVNRSFAASTLLLRGKLPPTEAEVNELEGKSFSTGFSPYLANGCLSPVQVAHRLTGNLRFRTVPFESERVVAFRSFISDLLNPLKVLFVSNCDAHVSLCNCGLINSKLRPLNHSAQTNKKLLANNSRNFSLCQD